MLPHRIEQKVPPATIFCLRCRVKLTRRLTHVLTGPVPKLDSSAGIECTNSNQAEYFSQSTTHSIREKKENATSMFTKAAHSHRLQKDEERETKKEEGLTTLFVYLNPAVIEPHRILASIVICPLSPAILHPSSSTS